MNADILNLKDTLTDKQATELKKTGYAVENLGVVSSQGYMKHLIEQGYLLSKGNRNSFRVQIPGETQFRVLNAAEAKLFFWMSKGREGIIKASGYSEYRIH